MSFTKEELAEMARADAEIEREFTLTTDEIRESKRRDEAATARMLNTSTGVIGPEPPLIPADEYQARKRMYLAEHPGASHAQAWRAINAERVRWVNKKYRIENPERHREHSRKNYEKNRKKNTERSREYYCRNKEAYQKRKRSWYERNREYAIAYNREYRKRKKTEQAAKEET